RQVFLHLYRVVNRHLRAPTHSAAQSHAVEFGASQLINDVERTCLVVEKVVVGAEEIAEAVLLVQTPHLLGDSFAALDAILPLVVGGNRAIRTIELAAEGQNKRADRAPPTHLIGRQRVCAERFAPAGRLEQPIPMDWMWQLVEISDKALH